MKKKIIIIAIPVLTVLILAAWKIYGSASDKPMVVWETQRPTRGDISIIVTTTGTVQPVNTVSVGTQVSGTIKKLYVDYNSVVKKGQLLAEVDRTLFEASLSQAKSNYEQIHSQLVFQESNFARQKELYELGAISKAEFDNAQFTYNSAKAQANAAAAQVQTAQKNLSFTSITSPIDGTVLSRSVSEGQTVAASFNTPTIFSIANDLTQMQVEASVDEADIGNVKEGEKVSFSVDAYVDEVFTGTVSQVRLNPTTNNNVVTYTTIIKASNPGLKLKPGMTASITIYTAESSNALLIPVKSIKFKPDSSLAMASPIQFSKERLRKDESFVLVKKGPGFEQVKVKTGLNNNTQVEVLSGLTESDEIVTNARVNGGSQAQAQGTPSSPFMPKRPGSSKKTK